MHGDHAPEPAFFYPHQLARGVQNLLEDLVQSAFPCKEQIFVKDRVLQVLLLNVLQKVLQRPAQLVS